MCPIRGMTDPESITPRFPRLGKLRKGGERVEKTRSNGTKYTVMGPDLEYFRFTSDRPEIVAAFKAAYGDKPTSILVYLPYITPEENFPTWCELWNESGMLHRCDGENMVIWLEGSKYVKGSKPCVGGHKDGDARNDCIGRLALIIPELVQAGFAGYVTMETHSKNDIVGISNVLADVFEMRGQNEMGLRGISFNLKRMKENISVPGWGERKDKRSRTDKFLVKIEPVIEWVKLQLDYDRRAAMALPAGDPQDQPVDATEDEIGDIEPGEEYPNGDFADEDTNGHISGDAGNGASVPVEQPASAAMAPASAPTSETPRAEDHAAPVSLEAFWPKPFKVSYGRAILEIDDDDNLLIDLPSENLAHQVNKLIAEIKKNGLTQAQKDDKQIRVDTITEILKARAAQAAQPAML
jgi:hypothetical protein